MPREATDAMFERVDMVRSMLRTLEQDLRTHGDRELADSVKRARRELMHSSVTGAEHTKGVNAHAVRR